MSSHKNQTWPKAFPMFLDYKGKAFKGGNSHLAPLSPK